jgi:hypothetical protein
MHVIEVLRKGEWVAWTSTANRERLPALLGLARLLHPGKQVRVRP